jgi:hypothetical protein
MAQHYAAGVQAVAHLSAELLVRSQSPQNIAADLRQLIRPDLQPLVDEMVSAVAIELQRFQPS